MRKADSKQNNLHIDMATKKAQKVVTPIDQRETFVSIQKNFAESSISIEDQLRTLYALQQADTKIDKIMQLRGELPLEVEALEQEVAEINAKIEKNEAEIAEFTSSIAANKNNAAECASQLAKYREHLDNITNSREYDSLQKEIENQDLLLQIAEKRIGEAKEEIAARKNEIARLQDRKAVKNADLEAKNAELATIVESTAKEEAELRKDRDACAAKIDERTMNAYEKVRNSYVNHLAVVPLYGNNACGGCMNTVPPQRIIEVSSNKKIIICEYCGRILVNPESHGINKD